jgi:light-regulated signal transduction histidine kinase (bacteriophytochrome)
MKRLIGDMMHFARAGNLSNQQPSAETDAGAVAGLAMANLGEAIRESAANIVVAPLPAVYANESALLRVFQNLMANAIKYRGEKSPQVRVSAEQRNQEWVFSIRDNGIGIDPAYHATIFEPFHRLHARSKYDGSGLGLAACRRIVASWRGRIWVESQPGEGSTFFFTIPADAVPGSAPAERKPSGKEERLLEQARRTAGAGEF